MLKKVLSHRFNYRAVQSPSSTY